MRILLDNVNLKSTSGPNHFGKKLKKNFEAMAYDCGVELKDPDVQLSFIETYLSDPIAPMILRLDGIYMDPDNDFIMQNRNIRRSYEMSSGVVFQSNYSKELVFTYFGEHPNYTVIHNAADLEYIASIPTLENEFTRKFDTIWCCASSWYYNNNPQTPRTWKKTSSKYRVFFAILTSFRLFGYSGLC